MKVSVCCVIQYSYEVDLPETLNTEETCDLLNYVDTEDPVYRDLCGVLGEAYLNYQGDTVSIVAEDTDEVLYCE